MQAINESKQLAQSQRSSGMMYFVKVIAFNLALLGFQGYMVYVLDQSKSSVAEVFMAMIFIGTLGLSIKMWFYAILAIFIVKTSTSED